MIKASDLRIGNLARNAFGNIVRISHLEDEYIMVDPIELTPETLEAAGFKKDTIPNPFFSGWSIDLGRGRELSVSNPGTPNEMIFINETDIDGPRHCVVARNFDYDGKTYLHQLQNLFFAITGTELSININK